MIGRPSPSASAREAKAARRSWIRRSSSPARARIAPPGVLEVGQVSAYFLAGYDPVNVTWTGKGSQDANSGVKERHHLRGDLGIAKTQLGRIQVDVLPT